VVKDVKFSRKDAKEAKTQRKAFGSKEEPSAMVFLLISFQVFASLREISSPAPRGYT
jgi:hypothetical protein